MTETDSKDDRHLSLLQHRGLLNFRDLGLSSEDNADGIRYIKEGLVFRSATLDNLNQDEVEQFVKDHDIRTIVDLRTSHEGREGAAIDKSFPTTVAEQITHIVPTPSLHNDHNKMSSIVKEEEFNGTIARKKYRIAFTGKNFERYGIFMTCTLRQKLRLLIIYILFCQRQRATSLIGREVLSPMGIGNLYKKLVTYCQEEVVQTLMIFTKLENYPIHVHCTQGKDRTGLVSCLLLSIAGAPDEVIIKDYAKTQAGLAPIRKEMLHDLRRVGLSDEFADAPAQNMRGLLEYIKITYGSITNYLDQIGFNEENRERVRLIIRQQ
ncbi:protein-tyrosine phosphatase-like protein [Phascolomyces articulosus]|uniref:Protein-tyrosine phosphatase-like protein n=1 Tax=Phascolomyces articulosus TaxID=60185 RepID=A0AAD5JKF5_9FUNG|nr:protein-tyrosine phosphatase-like protein [Phascolomyces articulosus]